MRIVRQLLTEGLVIAILGGGVGVLLSYWGIGFLRANLSFNEAISAVPSSLDWNVVLFALVVSLVSALLCGVAPSLNASHADINVSLKNESRAVSGGRSRSLMRKFLVTAEIALALFLLIGVGLLIRGIYQIEHQDLGFRSDHLLTATLMLDDARYGDADKKKIFVQNVLDRLRQASGAEAVAVASDLPVTGPGSVTLIVKDHPELPTEQQLSALDFLHHGRVGCSSLPRMRRAGTIKALVAPPLKRTRRLNEHRIRLVRGTAVAAPLWRGISRRLPALPTDPAY